MAYFGFTNKLLKGETIQIFNYGNCKRDFTYVDDIVEGVVRVMQGAPERKNGEDGLPVPPYAVYRRVPPPAERGTDRSIQRRDLEAVPKMGRCADRNNAEHQGFTRQPGNREYLREQ